MTTSIKMGSSNGDIGRLNRYLAEINKTEQESSKRNKEFLSEIKQVTHQASYLNSKTEKLREIRDDYEGYIKRLYPQWKKLIKNQPQVDDINKKDSHRLKKNLTSKPKLLPDEKLYGATNRDVDDSEYPTFLKKKMDRWRHDTSMNTPDELNTGPNTSYKERLRLLEESYLKNQKRLKDVEQILHEEKNFGTSCRSSLSKSPHRNPTCASYLGDPDRYIPSERGSYELPLRTSSPDKYSKFLPVQEELHRSPYNHSAQSINFDNSSTGILNPNFNSQSLQNSSFNGDPNTVRILPQLIGLTPSGQLVLLPMTAPLNTVVSSSREGIVNDQVVNESKHSIREGMTNLERNFQKQYPSDQNNNSSVQSKQMNLPDKTMSQESIPYNSGVIFSEKFDTQQEGINSFKTENGTIPSEITTKPRNVVEIKMKNVANDTDRIDKQQKVQSREEELSKVLSANFLAAASSQEKSHVIQDTNLKNSQMFQPEIPNSPLNFHDSQNERANRDETPEENSFVDSFADLSFSLQNSPRDLQSSPRNLNEGEQTENSKNFAALPQNTNDQENPVSPVSNMNLFPLDTNSKSNKNDINSSQAQHKLNSDEEDVVTDLLQQSKEPLSSSFSDNESDFDLPSNADDDNSAAILTKNYQEHSTDKMKTVEQCSAKPLNDHDNVAIKNRIITNDDVNLPVENKHVSPEQISEIEDMEKNSPTSKKVEVEPSIEYKHDNTPDDQIANPQNEVNLLDGLNQSADDSFDDSVLFRLLDCLMERVNDEQSEEVLVLNLELDMNLINTIVSVADMDGDLSRFNASELCMVFRYQLELSMTQNQDTPFIIEELDANNDFEGHLRDCIAPRYLDIWDGLFAFLSSIMDVFEFNPSQVATIYAFTLVPVHRELADQLRISLTTILSATLSDADDLNKVDDDEENSDYPGEEQNKTNVSITEAISMAADSRDGKLSPIDTTKTRSSHGKLSKTLSLEAQNSETVKLAESFSMGLGSVTYDNDKDETSSTISFDSDGMPVRKIKNESEKKNEYVESYSEDFASYSNASLNQSESYMKMRKETLASPIQEDSDGMDDLLGEGLGLSKTKDNFKLSSKNEKINNGTTHVKKKLNTISSTASVNKEEGNTRKREVESPPVISISSQSSSKVKLRKPGFWNEPESDSDFEVTASKSFGQHKQDNEGNDDDFDFDFYD